MSRRLSQLSRFTPELRRELADEMGFTHGTCANCGYTGYSDDNWCPRCPPPHRHDQPVDHGRRTDPYQHINGPNEILIDCKQCCYRGRSDELGCPNCGGDPRHPKDDDPRV